MFKWAAVGVMILLAAHRVLNGGQIADAAGLRQIARAYGIGRSPTFAGRPRTFVAVCYQASLGLRNMRSIARRALPRRLLR